MPFLSVPTRCAQVIAVFVGHQTERQRFFSTFGAFFDVAFGNVLSQFGWFNLKTAKGAVRLTSTQAQSVLSALWTSEQELCVIKLGSNIFEAHRYVSVNFVEVVLDFLHQIVESPNDLW